MTPYQTGAKKAKVCLLRLHTVGKKGISPLSDFVSSPTYNITIKYIFIIDIYLYIVTVR